MEIQAPPPTATKGLATVALLKVNFDAGRDHLSMFEPFVLDTLAQIKLDGVAVKDVREAIAARHQLFLPINTLRTLLDRAVKRGYIRRDAGRYFGTGKGLVRPDVRLERLRVEERQERVAEALREYGAAAGVAIGTTEDALAMVLEFLQQYHVPLALEDIPDLRLTAGSDPSEQPQEEHRRSATTAAFLLKTVRAGGDLADVIQEMLEGFVLQNTLLLKDISMAGRRFKNLAVFCDSAILFAALGLHGSASEAATKELLSLLQQTGATLNIFETTMREMRRILIVYEQRIGTSDGRLSLYPSDLTRYFLTNQYSPSDVRAQASMIERNLRGLGFNLRELPPHQASTTLDEADLAARIARGPGGENEPRVVHDIDCVAGVLTLRKGKTSDSLDEAGAVFVTRSGLTVRNTVEWYERQGNGGVPPIIHQLLLSNLAWLKRPASAGNLKLHELIALCVAALRPPRETWQVFQRHLKKLQETGELSSDEVTAIVASSLTDRLLLEEELDDDSDSATLSEVVDRVKATYASAADVKIGEAQMAAQRSEAEELRVRMHVERRARGIAASISWILAGIFSASLIFGTLLTIYSAITRSSLSTAGLVLAFVPLGLAGLLSLLWGISIDAWRRRAENTLSGWVRQWLAGTPRNKSGDNEPIVTRA